MNNLSYNLVDWVESDVENRMAVAIIGELVDDDNMSANALVTGRDDLIINALVHEFKKHPEFMNLFLRAILACG